jgi:Na+-transporting NADH:ubiquinone oxidoreductase subunit NqrC
MGRQAVHLLAVTALAVALAGCGGKSSSPAPTTTAATAPTITSASDLAACNALETSIRVVSQIVSNSVEAMTQSLHPKQLAKRTGDTQKNLLYAANLVSRIVPPRSLVQAQRELIVGLRLFAADFGRAQKSVARNDMAKASRQLVDRRALAKLKAATNKIDRACGA